MHLRTRQANGYSAGLKQACPEGVFASLTPGDPSLWSVVLFVRNGPYSPAALRFQISFPNSYPRLPPLVTFSTDMFHPLITPLTTYMYTTDVQGDGTVSATDEERLPPGGFSLRGGFPEWFGRGKQSTASSRQVSGQQIPSETPERGSLASPDAKAAMLPSYMQTRRKTVPIYDILRYIKSAFDDEEVLDSLPLDAAGNPGAWHAWRTHQRKQGKLSADLSTNNSGGSKPSQEEIQPSTTEGPKAASTPATTRRPGEWNWDGVWEDRVKKAIAASLSEPVLFGSGGPDELIRFLAMEDSEVESAKENLMRTLESSA
ncbi:ubiquitin-conjugating enzyme [Paramyrothecium foliicola]|nr:ubiquitin-conjugating enzyme [Paramyrothecium foliicola]